MSPEQAISEGVVFRTGIKALPQASITVGVVGATLASTKQSTVEPAFTGAVKSGTSMV
jgi:hypothetical protein